MEVAVTYQIEDCIATITLNRPERMNAVNGAMESELREAMGRASEDSGVRVIILTGAGKAFCAGKDIADMGAAPAAEQDGRFTYLRDVPKPVIASVNGAAAGLGMVIALYADVRIAGSAAFFTPSFSKRGLVAEHGIAWLLPRMVGTGRAMELLMSSRRIGADEAAGMGLVSRAVDSSVLATTVRDYARELADSVSPRSLRVIKRQVWGAMVQSFSAALASAGEEQRLSLDSDDFREGVRHFVEKRPPKFSGG